MASLVGVVLLLLLLCSGVSEDPDGVEALRVLGWLSAVQLLSVQWHYYMTLIFGVSSL
jgi:hypothetical protein